MADSVTENGNIRGISGNILKLVACFSMFADHFGEIFLKSNATKQGSYLACRFIGRLAFPIFAFLLVEGFLHTSSKLKYFLRLLALAFLSEIPFDLAFSGKIFSFENQNIVFELAVGLLILCLCGKIFQNDRYAFGFRVFLGALTAILLGAGAFFLQFDYGIFGILFIFLLYFFKDNRLAQIFAGVLSFGLYGLKDGISELAVLAFIPIYFYSGRKGKNIKYFFYIFYPAHLLLLFFLKQLLIGN